MANLIDFEIQFKEAQNSLRQLRKKLESELSQINVSFDAEALKVLTKGSPSRVAAGASGIKSGVTDKIQGRLDEVTKKLSERTQKRAILQNKIAAAEAEVAAGNKSLSRSLGSLRGHFKKEENAILDLVQESINLTSTLDKIQEIMESAGVVFAAGAKAVEFRGIQREAEALEQALANQRKPLEKRAKVSYGKIVAPGIQTEQAGFDRKSALDVSAEQIKRAYKLRKLNISDDEALLQAALLMAEEDKRIAAIRASYISERKLQAEKTRVGRELLKEADKGVNKKAKEEEKQQTKVSTDVDKAFSKANTAELKAESSKAEFLLKERNKIIKQANIDAEKASRAAIKALQAGEASKAEFLMKERERLLREANKQVEKAFRVTEKAVAAESASRSEFLFNQREKIINKANKDSEAAFKKANQAVQAGDTSRAEFLFKKNQQIAEKANKAAEAATRKAAKAQLSGEADKAEFLLKERNKQLKRARVASERAAKIAEKAVASGEASRAEFLLKQKNKQQEEINKLVDKAFSKANLAEQKGESDRASFLLKKKNETLEAENKARKKSLDKAKKDVDAAFIRADEGVRLAESKKADAALRKNVKAIQDEERLRREIIAIEERGKRELQKKLLKANLPTGGTTGPSSLGSEISGKIANSTILQSLKPAVLRFVGILDSFAQNEALNDIPDVIEAASFQFGERLKFVSNELIRISISDLPSKITTLRNSISSNKDNIDKYNRALQDIASKRNVAISAGADKKTIRSIDEEYNRLARSAASLVEETRKEERELIELNKLTEREQALKREKVNLEASINNLKQQEARAIGANVAKEEKARHEGLRGALRRFGNSGPPGGGPPNNPPNNPPGGGSGGGGDFNKRITLGNSLLQRLIGNLGIGDEAALKFGATMRRAAENLAAWAAPSILVFKTIGILQDAVGKVVELDTQVRRLVFFQATNTGGGLAAFNEQMEKIGNVTKDVEANFAALFNEAQRAGIAVEKISEAASTVSRIGEIAFFKDGTPSELLKAVEGLVKIEGGALSAERAAELLTAITQQMNLSFDDSQVLASKLAAAAADASFSLEGMGSVVARFAAAAQDVQGLTLDQVFALASEASKRFGLNASRAGTSLKNLTTLIVERRKEIEELTGIQIDVGEGGLLRGKEALFDVLEAIKSLQGTAAGFKLGKLLGDRQNISDIFNLSSAVKDLRANFSKLEDEEFVAGKASAEFSAFLNQQDNISQGVQASIDRLSNSFQRFAKNSGIVDFIAKLTDQFTEIVTKITDVTSGVFNSEGAFTSLGAIATAVLANIAKKSALAGIGFFTNKVGDKLRKDVERGLNQPFKSEAPVRKLEEAGIIDNKTANNFITQGNKLTEQKITLESQISTQRRISDKLAKSESSTLFQQVTSRQKLNALEAQHKNVLLQEFLLREKIAKSTGRFGQLVNGLKANAGSLISAAAGIGLVFGDTIARSIADKLGSSDSKALISRGVSNLFTGASLGAELGSVFGPIGALVGSLAGTIIASVKNVIDNVKALFGVIPEELENKIKEAKERGKRQQENRAAAKRAADVSIAQIRNQRLALISAADLLNKKELERRKTILDIKQLEQELAKLKADGNDTSAKEQQIRNKTNELRKIEKQLTLDEKKIAEEKTAEFERQYALIQAISQRQLAAANIAKLARTAGVKDEGFLLNQDALFDKASIASELEAIEREIDVRRSQIRSIADDPERQSEARQLEIKNNQDAEKVIGLRFKVVEREAQLIKDTYNLAEKNFTNQIEQQKRIVGELRDAFSGLISAQERIVSLSRDNASINTRIAQTRRDSLVDVELPGRTLGDRQAALQNRINNNRAFAEEIGRQINQSEADRINNRAFVNAGTPQFFGSEIDQELSSLKDHIISVTSELEGADGKFAADSAARREILNQDIQSFKDKIEAEKRALSVDRDALNARISLNGELIASERERIDIEKQQIDILRERAAKEASLGENILKNPQAVLQDILSAQSARNFFGKNNTPEEIFAAIQKERDKNGNVRLLKVLEGIEALQRLGVENVNGIKVEDLREMFLRLQLPNGRQNVENSANQEREARQNIQNSADSIVKANNDIIDSLTKLKFANDEQIKLEDRLREIEKARISVLEKQSGDIQAKLPQIFNNFEQASIIMRDSMAKFSGIINETNDTVARLSQNFGTLDQEIAKLIEVLKKDKLEGSIFDAGRRENSKGKAGKIYNSGFDIQSFASVIGETMTRAVASFEEKLNNATVRLEADIPALEVELRATVQNVLNGDEFLAKLAEELKGTGLEDRVEQIKQIVLQLVAVERTRGTRLPPTF